MELLQPVEKEAIEETETNKQEDVEPPKDDGKEDEKKNSPRKDNSSELEIPVTKAEKVPVLAEVEKVDNFPCTDVPAEVNNVDNTVSEEPLEILSEEKVAIEASKETPQEKPGAEAGKEDAEETVPVGTVVQEEKSAVESLPEEKPLIEAVENAEKEKKAVEVAKNVDEEPEVEAVEKERPPAETLPEEKPATETVEGAQEDKPSVEEVEKLPEEKPAAEAVGSVQGVNPAETSAEEKPAAVVEEAEKLEKEEPAATNANVQELIEKVNNHIKEETDDNKAKDNTATEQVEEEIETENVEPISSTEDVGRSADSKAMAIVDEMKAKRQEPSKVIVEEFAEKFEKDNHGTKPAEKEENISAGAEPTAIEISPATNDEAQADLKEVANDSPVSGIVEKIDDERRRDGTTVIETDIAELKEEKNVKMDQVMTEEKNEKTESVIASERASSIAAQVTEKSLVEEQESRDVEVIKKKEDLPSAENERDVAEATVDVKAEETNKKAETNLESTEEAVVDGKKADPPTKEGDDTKNSKEFSAKPPQKSSGNLLSKVKQSLGKVKKAIVGKSPSSKTLQSEAKGDENIN